jgi:hypothetical protein
MLRLFVLLLLLANGAYFAWAQGLLAPLGLAPSVQAEPQRLGQQIKPDQLRLLRSDELKNIENATAARAAAASAVAASSTPPVCLQAGPFDEEQARALRPLLGAALSSGSWSLAAVAKERWIIYMGKYTSPPALEKKRSELREIQVPFTDIAQGLLAPGLSLGSFDSQAEADSTLTLLARQGVRTAKVLPGGAAAGSSYLLKLPLASAELRTLAQAQLQAAGEAVAAKALQTCP